jgi:hypothetical protein
MRAAMREFTSTIMEIASSKLEGTSIPDQPPGPFITASTNAIPVGTVDIPGSRLANRATVSRRVLR